MVCSSPKTQVASVRKVSLREMFEGFPLALTIYYATVVVFTAFNFGFYLVATTSQSLLAAWLNVSRPFTDWMAGFFPLAVNSITTHLQRSHSLGLIPIHENVFLIDFALMIVFIGCFIIGVSGDVWASPATTAVSAKRLTERFGSLGVSIPGLILRASIFFLIAATTAYCGVLTPHSVSLLWSIETYYVVLGVGTLGALSAIHFVVIWLLLKWGAADKN